MQKYPMTVTGAAALEEELRRLKTIERPAVIEAIATAREHGDLKENAEYHAAREQQSFIEGRIAELEGKLSHAQIVDVTKMPQTGKIIFGATVQLLRTSDDAELKYQIVGEDEADIKQDKISFSSPIGRALIGKMVDDVVEVQTPGGLVEYEITGVEYL